jgi:hypothetical protein
MPATKAALQVTAATAESVMVNLDSGPGSENPGHQDQPIGLRRESECRPGIAAAGLACRHAWRVHAFSE